MNTIPGTKAERRAFHEARSRGSREEDKNPDDCGCGRSWYKRYWDPLSRRYHKICPGCHKEIRECACLLSDAIGRTGGDNITTNV